MRGNDRYQDSCKMPGAARCLLEWPPGDPGDESCRVTTPIEMLALRVGLGSCFFFFFVFFLPWMITSAHRAFTFTALCTFSSSFDSTSSHEKMDKNARPLADNGVIPSRAGKVNSRGFGTLVSTRRATRAVRQQQHITFYQCTRGL